MLIPNFQYTKIVDDENDLTPAWRQILELLLQQMQNDVSNNGFVIPSRTTAEIATLATMMPNGTMWYDSTINKFKGLELGVVKTFTTV